MRDPKFKVNDLMKISNYKQIFAKCYTPNWSEEVSVIKTGKNNVPWTYIKENLQGEKLVRTFCKQELQKTTQTDFRVEKVIKEKGDKLYVKWKGFDNSLTTGEIKKISLKKQAIIQNQMVIVETK